MFICLFVYLLSYLFGYFFIQLVIYISVYLFYDFFQLESDAGLAGREEKLQNSFKLVESDLTLLGVTAIEDRLQVQFIEFLTYV